MVKASSTPPAESLRMADLRNQLRGASTPEAQRQVMVSTLMALRDNEISVEESKIMNKEFAKINAEARARLKAARRALR